MKIISIIISTTNYNPAIGYTFNVHLSNGGVIEETSDSLYDQFKDEQILEAGTNLEFLVGQEFKEEWL